MTKENMKFLLLGKATYFLQDRKINYSFWKLIERIDLIIDSNIQYESYDMEAMERDLYQYCESLKESE